MLQASPDFKGIKTVGPGEVGPGEGFKPALISKGLRLDGGINLAGECGFKPALISKGLRLWT